jgi:hypothetical protein
MPAHRPPAANQAQSSLIKSNRACEPIPQLGYRLLAIGYWLSAIGCRRLAVGDWLSAIGYSGPSRTRPTRRTEAPGQGGSSPIKPNQAQSSPIKVNKAFEPGLWRLKLVPHCGMDVGAWILKFPPRRRSIKPVNRVRLIRGGRFAPFLNSAFYLLPFPRRHRLLDFAGCSGKLAL